MTTSSHVALQRLGLYGNKIDMTRHSRKDASSFIHKEDPNWIGLRVGLYSLAVLRLVFNYIRAKE